MLSEALVDAVSGRTPRLLVMMPPRHGKSSEISHYLPVWFLNNWPSKRVILSSYEADFAASWGRKVRNTITGHRDDLRVRMSHDSASADRWDTTQGGGMVTTGVGGPITGRGANLLIVDDPVKNRLALMTPVPTPGGWSTMGTVQAGDLVLDEAGRPTVVVGVSEITTPERCYELLFDDGTSVIASYDHPWLTRTQRDKGEQVRTTEEMFTSQRYCGKTNHSIAVMPGLDLPPSVLPLPPYTLGAWLGDGDSSCPRITTGVVDAPALAEAIRSEGIRVDSLGPYAANPNVAVLSLRLAPQGSHNAPLKGLYGNKHIPPAYLRASYTQRLHLLQGLLDTDGTADEGGQVALVLKNERLITDSLELMRSLGWKPRLHAYDRAHGKVFVLSGTPPRDQQAFRLARKQARLHQRPTKRSRHGRRYVVAVEAVTPVACRCLSVANPAHLYLVGKGFVTTHNSEEANSQTYRDKTWEWWTSTAYTRLEPGGVAVVVETRWHEDDLGGRLLREMEQGGERWRSICLPALAEANDPLGRQPGEALWPERYDVKALAGIKQAVGSRVWASLYQQSPLPPGGVLFNREWFPVVDAVPADAHSARYWDMAATEARVGSDPDWTAGCLMAEQEGIYYIVDIRRVRERPRGVEHLIRQTAELDGTGVDLWIEQEPGASGVNTIDHYSREVLKGFAVRGQRATGSKVERANPLSAAAEAGNVRLVRGAWINIFLDELQSFPLGAHDDQVDAASGAMAKLNAFGGWMM